VADFRRELALTPVTATFPFVPAPPTLWGTLTDIAATVAPEPIGPVPGSERITVIDTLRGAALFGILIANMRGFNAPMGAYFQPQLMWTWMPDRLAQAFVDWMVQGKFITIFAALFGVGFAIQLERATARGQSMWFYARRLAALFVIGLAHSFLLWWGDILTNYALCGFFLLFFRRRTQKTVLVWGHILYWFILALFGWISIAAHFGWMQLPADDPSQHFAETIRAYAHGTVREVFAVRAREWMEANSFLIFLTRIIGIFLFGLYIWRQGYLRNPAEHLGWWQRAQRVGLPIGIAGNLIVVALQWIYEPNPMRPSILNVTLFAIQSFAIPALSLGYVATVVLLWQNAVWQQRLLPFSYVGRMALTNYLLQSLICTTIFYSYGLGLYGRVGPLLDLALGLVIYSLQIPFSRWWLSNHAYGPMESVWRVMTYGFGRSGAR
jgi:uncharacterized protein